jgi:hypothetical protein
MCKREFLIQQQFVMLDIYTRIGTPSSHFSFSLSVCVLHATSISIRAYITFVFFVYACFPSFLGVLVVEHWLHGCFSLSFFGCLT